MTKHWLAFSRIWEKCVRFWKAQLAQHSLWQKKGLYWKTGWSIQAVEPFKPVDPLPSKYYFPVIKLLNKLTTPAKKKDKQTNKLASNIHSETWKKPAKFLNVGEIVLWIMLLLLIPPFHVLLLFHVPIIGKN